MKARQASSRYQGHSLVEVLVASALVFLILAEVWAMFAYGGRFYMRLRGQSEVQANSILAFRWLSKDIGEAAPVSFRHYGPDRPTALADRTGLVFGSSRDVDDVPVYNDQGIPMWASVTYYHVDPQTRILFRGKAPLAKPVGAAPVIEDSLFHIDSLVVDPQQRKVAVDIEELNTVVSPTDLTVTIHCRNRDAGVGLKVQTRLEMRNR